MEYTTGKYSGEMLVTTEAGLPEWHTVAHIGNKMEDVALRQFYRVLTLDGNYIAEFQPNWRG